MRSNNPFDRFFNLGSEEELWTNQMIEEFMEELGEQDFGPSRRLHDYDGYRREVVDGDVTEYYLEDGEWKEFGEGLSEQSLDFDLKQLDDEYEMTVDLTSQLPNVATSTSASASINNGILNLTFEMDSGGE
jgi:hypothetical protein